MELNRLIKILYKLPLPLVITTVTIGAVMAGGCANETDAYAGRLNLPKQNKAIVRQLKYDDNTRALLDEISYLPEAYQLDKRVLNYLKDIAKDRKVTDNELAEFSDFDGNLSNRDELKYGTDLFDPDTDGDKILDGENATLTARDSKIQEYLGAGIVSRLVWGTMG